MSGHNAGRCGHLAIEEGDVLLAELVLRGDCHGEASQTALDDHKDQVDDKEVQDQLAIVGVSAAIDKHGLAISRA